MLACQTARMVYQNMYDIDPFLPYIMPGFDLARVAAERLPRESGPRTVGMVLLNHIMRLAKAAGAAVRADFVETGRNRMMQITYAFAGFREVERDGDQVVLEADLDSLQPPPSYVALQIVE